MEVAETENIEESVKESAFDKLTAKQKLFVTEYLIDYNGTRAAIASGYSEKAAAEQAYENLRKPHIKAAIDEIFNEIIGNTKQRAARVIEEYEKIAFSNITDFSYDEEKGTVKCNSEDGNTQAVSTIKITETKKKDEAVVKEITIKLWDKNRALDSIARTLGIFVDKKEIDVFDKRTLESELAEKSEEELEALAEK